MILVLKSETVKAFSILIIGFQSFRFLKLTIDSIAALHTPIVEGIQASFLRSN